MAEEKPPAESGKGATKPKTPRRTAPKAPKPESTAKDGGKEADETPAPVAPRRPSLEPDRRRLLAARRRQDRRRPRFTRQQSYRYLRVGRFGAWRRPRGLQSKQRRHYGYRSTIVRIGYRSPRAVRGLAPSGFEPVLVHTSSEIERMDAKFQAVLIARTVGTRRRLVLEEVARQKGLHVLNPLVRETEET